MASIKKIAHYRHSANNQATINLDTMISRAIQAVPSIRNRLMVYGENNEFLTFINKFSHHASGYVTGIVTVVKVGADAELISNIEETDDTSVNPEIFETGEDRDFVTGQIHFVVMGNHVAYLQDGINSPGLVESSLEFLRTGGTLQRDAVIGSERVILTHKSTIDWGNIGEVRKITIAGAVTENGAANEEVTVGSKGGLFGLLAGFSQHLNEVGIGNNIASHLITKIELGAPKNLEEPFLNSLSTVLRNTDLKYSILKKGGEEITSSDETRIKEPIEVESNSGILQYVSVRDSLRDFLRELITQNRV